MDREVVQAIDRVIHEIHRNLGERITIDDMARIAMFSKFHFTRLFQRVTGIPPARFLYAVRLQEAKRLLLSTSLTVTEISTMIGYSSLGTFSTRFKSCVGLSPTAYRELRGFTPQIPTDDGRRTRGHTVTIRGRVRLQSSAVHDPVFLGVFPEPIAQGSPIRCAFLRRPGPFVLDRVPQGTWYLLAQAVRAESETGLDDGAPNIGVHGPLSVRPGSVHTAIDLRLRPSRPLDPPVLLALLDVRQKALSASAI